MFLSEWREIPSAPCLTGKKKILMTARVSTLLKSRASLTCYRACFLPGRTKDLSAARYFFEQMALLFITRRTLSRLPCSQSLFRYVTDDIIAKYCRRNPPWSAFLCSYHRLILADEWYNTGLLTNRCRVGKKETEHPKHRGEGCHDNVATKWNRWSCGSSSIIAFCVMQVHLAQPLPYTVTSFERNEETADKRDQKVPVSCH